MDNIKINVEIEEVGDPVIQIYNITIENEGGVWEETFGSKETADAFLKGVKAAFSFTKFGFITIPEIQNVISI